MGHAAASRKSEPRTYCEDYTATSTTETQRHGEKQNLHGFGE